MNWTLATLPLGGEGGFEGFAIANGAGKFGFELADDRFFGLAGIGRHRGYGTRNFGGIGT
jgi:hypothetical protein